MIVHGVKKTYLTLTLAFTLLDVSSRPPAPGLVPISVPSPSLSLLLSGPFWVLYQRGCVQHLHPALPGSHVVPCTPIRPTLAAMHPHTANPNPNSNVVIISLKTRM